MNIRFNLLPFCSSSSEFCRGETATIQEACSGLRSRSPLALPRDVDAPIGGLRARLFSPGFLTALRSLTPDPRLRLVRLWAGRGGAGMLTDSRAS